MMTKKNVCWTLGIEGRGKVVRFVVLQLLLLKTEVFWDMTVCPWARSVKDRGAIIIRVEESKKTDDASTMIFQIVTSQTTWFFKGKVIAVLSKNHIMKICGKWRCSFTHSYGLYYIEVRSGSHPDLFYPWGKIWFPLVRKLSETKCQSGHGVKHLPPYQELDSDCPVCSLVTVLSYHVW